MANGYFGGGSGTEQDPFLVEDHLDLWEIRNNLSAHFKQVYNIDLNSFNANGGWTPIGTTSTPFTGTYDGSGFEIRNLWVANKQYASLFGKVSNAKIKNIFLLNTLIVSSTSSYMGGLIAYAENMANDSIYNCHVKGIINESVSSQDNIGGVVGLCSSSKGSIAINKCSFEGIIYGGSDSQYVGGIVGESQTSIKSCYSLGEIRATIRTSQTNPKYLGGLIGHLDSNCSCSHSYSLMKVDGGTVANYVGGLVGDTDYSTTILKCWARGDVKGNDYVGGLVGRLGYANSTVSNCYSAGKVEGAEESSNVGGLVGAAPNPNTVINSVWDIETSGQETSAGGIGKTTAEMKDPQTYIDLGWAI